MSDPVIALRGICHHYDIGGERVAALEDIDLDVHRNDYLAVTGASGSGKSTLMNVLACLDRPSAGTYLLNGTDVAGLRDAELARIRNRDIGLIFQSFFLVPRATALENVMQPLVYRGMRHAERRRRALAQLDRVGLGHRTGHLPNQLSGGQRQRVAIARALVAEPAVLLADEPTGNLDSATTDDVLRLFDALHGDGHTIVLVTHEEDVVARCRRAIRLRDGRLVNGDVHRR